MTGITFNGYSLQTKLDVPAMAAHIMRVAEREALRDPLGARCDVEFKGEYGRSVLERIMADVHAHTGSFSEGGSIETFREPNLRFVLRWRAPVQPDGRHATYVYNGEERTIRAMLVLKQL